MRSLLSPGLYGVEGGCGCGQGGQGGGGGGPLDFLRNNPQFQALRQVVQTNPGILQPMLQVRSSLFEACKGWHCLLIEHRRNSSDLLSCHPLEVAGPRKHCLLAVAHALTTTAGVPGAAPCYTELELVQTSRRGQSMCLDVEIWHGASS